MRAHGVSKLSSLPGRAGGGGGGELQLTLNLCSLYLQLAASHLTVNATPRAAPLPSPQHALPRPQRGPTSARARGKWLDSAILNPY